VNNYLVVYSICELNVTVGLMASFPTLFAAKKYQQRADLAMRNAGLSGTTDIIWAGEPGILIEDPDKFFEEF
jgi:hypothetical protein